MNINPYILLGIGLFFGLLYAMAIIFGWAKTRTNRRIIQELLATSEIQLYPPVEGCSGIKTISLDANKFVDGNGDAINISDYKTYLASGKIVELPQVKKGDLLLFDKNGKFCYAFEIPDLKDYR